MSTTWSTGYYRICSNYRLQSAEENFQETDTGHFLDLFDSFILIQMVRYEVALILQSLPKDKLKVAFQTALTTILNEGALLRQIQFLGHRKLPYRMKAHNAGYHHGR